jgi:hypothetical protein
MLANVYLHYVFDLWIEAWRGKVAVGEVIVVRYADDLVVGFESRTEAERFLEEFRERLAKFGLELHAEKTRLIEFGKHAERVRKQRGEGKPETFTFLGYVFSELMWPKAPGRHVECRSASAERNIIFGFQVCRHSDFKNSITPVSLRRCFDRVPAGMSQ